MSHLVPKHVRAVLAYTRWRAEKPATEWIEVSRMDVFQPHNLDSMRARTQVIRDMAASARAHRA